MKPLKCDIKVIFFLFLSRSYEKLSRLIAKLSRLIAKLSRSNERVFRSNEKKDKWTTILSIALAT